MVHEIEVRGLTDGVKHGCVLVARLHEGKGGRGGEEGRLLLGLWGDTGKSSHLAVFGWYYTFCALPGLLSALYGL